jgi:hypothetical protein
MKEKEKKIINEELKEYMNIQKIITNDRYKKNIYSSINLTSYNKKNIVLDSWDKIKNTKELDNERTFEDDLNDLFMQEKKELLYSQNKRSNSDNDMKSDSDCESISSCEIDKAIAKLREKKK